MTAPRAPEVLLTPPSQGYVALDIPSAAATFAIGSRPLESSPPPVLQLNIPTDGSLEMQYRQLMETAQRLQGMTLSLRPSFILVAPEAPLRPALASESFPSALPPRLSP